MDNAMNQDGPPNRPLPSLPTASQEEYDSVAEDEESFHSAGANSSISTISCYETPPRYGPEVGITVATNGQTEESTVRIRQQNNEGNTESTESEGSPSGGSRNVRFAIPSTSKEQGWASRSTYTTPPLHSLHSILSKSKRFDRLSSLSSPMAPSPLTAHLDRSWGNKFRNWVMWSFWDRDLMQQPFFTDCFKLDGTQLHYRYDKSELQSAVNNLLTKVDPLRWTLEDQNFLVVRVTQHQDSYLELFGILELEAEGITFQTSPLAGPSKGFSTKKQEDELLRCSFHILACGGLAEILAASVNYSDVLIVSGGCSFVQERKLYLALNYNKEERSQIIRVSMCPGLEEDGSMCLAEKIVPLKEDGRFKFSYFADSDSTHRRRTVEQHRDFKLKEFSRDGNQSLAYNRGDFPMPISKDADPREIYNLLLSPIFGRPQKETRHCSREGEGRQRSSQRPIAGNSQDCSNGPHQPEGSSSADELVTEDDDSEATGCSQNTGFSQGTGYSQNTGCTQGSQGTGRTRSTQTQTKNPRSRGNHPDPALPNCPSSSDIDKRVTWSIRVMIAVFFILCVCLAGVTYIAGSIMYPPAQQQGLKNFTPISYSGRNGAGVDATAEKVSSQSGLNPGSPLNQNEDDNSKGSKWQQQQRRQFLMKYAKKETTSWLTETWLRLKDSAASMKDWVYENGGLWWILNQYVSWFFHYNFD